METSEMRRRTRVAFKTEIQLEGAGAKLEGLTSRDISLKGLFVETDQKWPKGTPVNIGVFLTGASSSLSLSMKGIVARVEPHGLAIDFTEVDVDSFVHLRNIVMYNSADPSVIDDEITHNPAF